jgi:hypothetical protein
MVAGIATCQRACPLGYLESIRNSPLTISPPIETAGFVTGWVSHGSSPRLKLKEMTDCGCLPYHDRLFSFSPAETLA